MTRRGRLLFRLLVWTDQLATRWGFHDTSQHIRRAYLTIAWHTEPDPIDHWGTQLREILTSQPALNAAHDVARLYPTVRSIDMAEVLTAALEAAGDQLRENRWTP